MLGDHFDVAAALADAGYCAGRRALLERHGLGCWAISNHLVGQAVCDPSTSATAASCRRRCGATAIQRASGRAADRMKDTARAAAQLGVSVRHGVHGLADLASPLLVPPNDFAAVERGYEEFAERWGPIVDVFEAEGVSFGLEVHPTEIAYDFEQYG